MSNHAQRPDMGASMTMYRMDPAHDADAICAGTIAICTRDSVKAATATSWIMADYSFLGPNEYVMRYFIQGHILTMQRNECIRSMDGDWILFIDDDMVFQPDAISRIVRKQKETGADIVGALCFQRLPPHQPTMYYKSPQGGYVYREVWEDGETVDVDATGMAFCMITKTALDKIVRFVTADDTAEFLGKEERLKMPAAQFFQWGPRMGEDFNFCRAAKDAGCRIVVDTSTKIGHISEIVVDEKHFFQQMALRHEDEFTLKSRSNASVGLSTMTTEQAQRKAGMR